VTEIAAEGRIDRARVADAVPGEELHDGDVTVDQMPALHGIGGDEPVVYESSPDGGPARSLGPSPPSPSRNPAPEPAARNPAPRTRRP
jgi:hypothetical protein